ncbi:MAG: hypothetical protein LBG27_09290 [Spirochaetaceae bacterium]|nr:hypothetical protein [Spirochaetaceae bacterium]
MGDIFGDGQKVTNVACEYEKNIDPYSVSLDDFVVKDRKLLRYILMIQLPVLPKTKSAVL